MTWVLQDILLHKSLPCGCGFVEGIHVIVCPEHGEKKQWTETADTGGDTTLMVREGLAMRVKKKKLKRKNPVARVVSRKSGAGRHKDKRRVQKNEEQEEYGPECYEGYGAWAW